jgi:hypothetical protein
MSFFAAFTDAIKVKAFSGLSLSIFVNRKLFLMLFLPKSKCKWCFFLDQMRFSRAEKSSWFVGAENRQIVSNQHG